MPNEPYPQTPEGTEHRPRTTAKRLAELLRIRPAVVEAIASGEITDVAVVVEWPTSGEPRLLSDERDLAEWRQTKRDVDRFGVDAVKAAEERERQARQSAADA